MPDRLSEREYMTSLKRLEEEAARAFAAGGQSAEQAAVHFERAEFNLSVDFRLGRNVPPEVRERLWQVRSEIVERRQELIGQLAAGHLTRDAFAFGLQELVKGMAARLAGVLNPEQVHSFFGNGADFFIDPDLIGRE